MPPFELLLPIGAIAFYLLDSVLWLYGNELVFHRPGGRWGHRAGSDWLLFRRRLYLPNPLTPHRPLWRIAWSEAPGRGEPSSLASFDAKLQQLWPIRVAVISLLALIVIGLPLVLILTGQGLVLLGLFAAAYLLAAGAVICLWRQRQTLGFSPGTCVALTIDALACPPFAINLLRKIALRQPLRGDPLDVAGPIFSAQSMQALCAALSRSLRTEIDAEPELSTRHRQLVDYLTALQERSECQPAK